MIHLIKQNYNTSISLMYIHISVNIEIHYTLLNNTVIYIANCHSIGNSKRRRYREPNGRLYSLNDETLL